jgi:hypothetical protein
LLEWVKVVGPILVSWPIAVLVVALILRNQIKQLVEGFLARSGGEMVLGPIKCNSLGISLRGGH